MNMQNLSKNDNDQSLREVERFYVIDFDRCLSDTNKTFGLFEKVVSEQTDISRADMVKAREEVEKSGGSYSATGYIKEKLLRSGTVTSWEQLVDSYIHLAEKHDILESGARSLIEKLNDNQINFGILTYGDKEWQRIKLSASKVDNIPVIITKQKHKGHLLSSWQRSDSKFVIPKEITTDKISIIAKQLILIDDKASSFEGFPAINAIGFQVLSFDVKPVLSQLGSLPANVTRVNSLADIPV